MHEKLIPLTEEQLAFIEESTDRTAEKAARRGIRKARNTAAVGFVILLIGVLASIFVTGYELSQANKTIVRTGRVVAVDGCNRDFVNVQRLRSLFTRLEDASKQAFEHGRTTKEQYQQAITFYESERARLRLPDCRESERIITDNPNEHHNRTPVPLHP